MRSPRPSGFPRRWHSCWLPADARRRIVFAVHLLHLGGRLVIMRGVQPGEMVTCIADGQVQLGALIVGDAMGMPLVEELRTPPGRVDLSSLFSITSGRAIWSQHVRDRMLADRNPGSAASRRAWRVGVRSMTVRS